jgi:hypothetical protein
MESHQNIQQPTRTLLFGCNIIIPLPAVVAAATQARLQLVVPYDPADTFPCDDLNILCLAYKDSNIRDALTKYRESQDRLGGVGSGIESVKKIQHTHQVMGIRIDRLVFTNELVGLLIGRFSKLPRGQEFIHRTANKMKIIMDYFLDNITTTTVNGNTNLFEIVNHCLLGARVDVLTLDYTPHSHDISKFDDLPDIQGQTRQCSGQDLRNRWVYVLIYYIINVFSVSTAAIAPTDDINVKTLFNYIRLLIVLYKHLNITPASLTLIEYVNRIQPINLALITGVKEEVNKVFTVACVKEKSTHEKPSAADKKALLTAAKKGQSAFVKAKNTPTRVESSAAKVPKSSAVKASESSATRVPTGASAATAAESSAATASSKGKKGKVSAASKVSKAKGAAAAAVAARALSAVSEHVQEDSSGGGHLNRGTIRIQNHRSPKKTNNHTRKRQYSNSINKRKKNKNKHKYKNINPPSQSRSHHNRRKSNSKLNHKNVTFKRRRYNNNINKNNK